MHIALDNCTVRSWNREDIPGLPEHANNRKIWINLRDAFPHPYTLADAERYVTTSLDQDPETRFAIEVEGTAAGSIGFLPKTDVDRVSAEIGYWLSERYWNRGIMTAALKAVTAYAIENHGLTRVYATPFEWNDASFRVLEKAGYEFECRLRRSAIKDGRVIDTMLYAYVVG